jgi:hypothetical protein
MTPRNEQQGAGSRFRGLPRGVWALGLVSLFMDVSSEMVHSLLPVFVVSVVIAVLAPLAWSCRSRLVRP